MTSMETGIEALVVNGQFMMNPADNWTQENQIKPMFSDLNTAEWCSFKSPYHFRYVSALMLNLEKKKSVAMVTKWAISTEKTKFLEVCVGGLGWE